MENNSSLRKFNWQATLFEKITIAVFPVGASVADARLFLAGAVIASLKVYFKGFSVKGLRRTFKFGVVGHSGSPPYDSVGLSVHR